MNLTEEETLARAEGLFAELAGVLGLDALVSVAGVAQLTFDSSIMVELQAVAPGWLYVLYEAGFLEGDDFSLARLALSAPLTHELLVGFSFLVDEDGDVLLAATLPLIGGSSGALVSVLEHFVEAAALVQRVGLAVFLEADEEPSPLVDVGDNLRRSLRI
ncbi:MAG: CesT family type III secretion system chaperone [Alphaproteobacteria bacterium]